ncbi:MAG: signal peptidase II [Rickettsiales bacterium]|jgi:signal peptidase II|nr:signal peptidase II [Rickettsiales bacterium]
MKKMGKASAAIIACLFALDILSKALILAAASGSVRPWGDFGELFPQFAHLFKISEFFDVVLAWNTGVSFSLLSGSGAFNRWALIVLSLAIIRFIYGIMKDSDEPLDIVGFSMVIAGALGNVADRIRYGAVVDFLDFHIGIYHWPAFNLADASICLGVLVLVYRQLFKSK